MALRRGFCRYALSIQYHGSSFLGFAHLKEQENAILPDGTDLRGYFSIEGRLKQALQDMLGHNARFENIRVSSRTDRGVHALKNTCQIDIKKRKQKLDKFDIYVDGDDDGDDLIEWDADVLRRGLNHYLSQQGIEELPTKRKTNDIHLSSKKKRLLARRAQRKIDSWSFHYPMNELRILNMIKAPLKMENEYHEIDPTQPPEVDWNVRFSACQRTYMYRILECHSEAGGDWGFPFEWDRSWRIFAPRDDEINYSSARDNKSNSEGTVFLDVKAMQEAASHLVGTHDFSSFRSAGCQRASPVVTIQDIQVVSQPYGVPLLWESAGGLLGLGGATGTDADANDNNYQANMDFPRLVTVKVAGNAFLYHQVRNMIGALVAVGRGSISPSKMKDILDAKDRTIAPAKAPAHGLFLVDVQHVDIQL